MVLQECLCSLLFLWISALSCFTSAGMITLDHSSIEVQEDSGNVTVCLETDDAICLSVHSQEKEAEEGMDYKTVNTTLNVMAGGHDCVIVHIEDDNVPEPDETFEVVFTELIPDLAGCSTMDGGGSGGGSGGGMMMKTGGMLMPMVSNETVTITIIDNDMQLERGRTPGDRSAAIAGAVCGSLIAVILIAIIW
jgi:hypothetical protein